MGGMFLAAAPQAGELDEAAQAALGEAERLVVEAERSKALWLSAREALEAARRAAAAGDSTATLRHAARAAEQARLGLEQLHYPLVRD